MPNIISLGDFKNSKTYKSVSSLFTLPYWDHNILRYNLDVMHIEKNVFDNLHGTLFNLDGKTKDNLKMHKNSDNLCHCVVEMPRGRRKQTVESNEEYLSEDHVGQKKSQQTLAHESDSEMEEESFVVGGHQSGEVSEMEPNSKNPTDMDADIEVEDEGTEIR